MTAPADVLVIPERRYAIFRSALGADYAVVLTGRDMDTAPKWGGFVSWMGGVKPAASRVNKRRAALARVGGAK
jgi:hypothetical protein